MSFTRISKQRLAALQQKHGPGVTQGLLSEIFRYREDGNLLRENVYGGWSVAGTPNARGYLYVQVCGKKYLVHRLIWLLLKGRLPVDELDHEDHDIANNRIGNLLETDSLGNNRNRSLSRNNISGINGVSWRPRLQKWEASVQINGSSKHLGVFEGLFEAVAARKSAEITIGFHPNHGK